MSRQGQIRHKSNTELLELARARDTSADTLEILIESTNETVVQAVAEHPNTKPETLAALVPAGVQSPFELELARRLAQNVRTPDYALQRLELLAEVYVSRNPEQKGYVEFAVSICCNANTPLETAMRLLSVSQSNNEFRQAVATSATRVDILQMLQADRSKVVREQASQTLAQLRKQEPN